MIRPLVLHPCNFNLLLVANQYRTKRFSFAPIINDDVVTVFELIKIYISDLTSNMEVAVSSLPWAGAATNTQNILFCKAKSLVSNTGNSQSFDLTDGRGNGILYAGDELCFTCNNGSSGGATTFFCYVLTRQRDISMTEYIQIRSKFMI